jgi:hypothetical protein
MAGEKRRDVRPLPRVPPLALVRVFLLAAAAVGACLWAIARYYARPTAPAPPPATTEIPAPSVIPVP